MKTFCLITMIASLMLFILIGCTSKQSDQLTEQQKDQIKKELKPIGDNVIVGWQRLDVEVALQDYSSDLVVAGKKSLIDFQAYKKAWIDFNNSVATVKVTPISEDFTFVKNDIVIWTWFGKDETILKSGDKLTFDPHTYVTVYKKVAGHWKGIYLCSSGIPVTQAAEKK